MLVSPQICGQRRLVQNLEGLDDLLIVVVVCGGAEVAEGRQWFTVAERQWGRSGGAGT